MAHIQNRGIYILDSDNAPTFDPGAGGGQIAAVQGSTIVYFHDTSTTWTRVDIGTLDALDGNHIPIVRGDAIEDVEPTTGEVPSPLSGDSASIILTDGKHEFWSYSGTSWSKAYVLQADQASNLALGTLTSTDVPVTNSNGTGFTLGSATATLAGAMPSADKVKVDFISITQAVDLDELEAESANLVTLTGMSSDSTHLGSFTGTTITDDSTIQEALQELETALESISDFIQSVTDTNSIDLTMTGSALSADVNLSSTALDNQYTITEQSDGLRIDRASLTVFGSIALAQASALSIGDAYYLNSVNPDGVVSLGAGGPVFYKTS
jgi:hypothetical protein